MQIEFIREPAPAHTPARPGPARPDPAPPGPALSTRSTAPVLRLHSASRPESQQWVEIFIFRSLGVLLAKQQLHHPSPAYAFWSYDEGLENSGDENDCILLTILSEPKVVIIIAFSFCKRTLNRKKVPRVT